MNLYHDFLPRWEKPTIPHTAHTGASRNDKLTISFKEPQKIIMSSWNTFEHLQPKYTFASELDHRKFQELVFEGHLLMGSWNITSIVSDHNPDECRSQTLRLWRERDINGSLGVLKMMFFANRRTVKGVLSPLWVVKNSKSPPLHYPTELIFVESAFAAPVLSRKEKIRLSLQKQNTRDFRASIASGSTNDSVPEEKMRKWLEIEFSTRKDRTSFLAEWGKAY